MTELYIDSVLLNAASFLFLGIVVIWLAVNVIQPTQGIMVMAGDEIATAMGEPAVEVEYTPDYTILFILPVMGSFMYLYMANKEKQEQQNGGPPGEMPIAYRG